MPSPYSSPHTQGDARAMAARLGIACIDLGIEPAMHAFDAILADVFAGREHDITEENLQARIRGTLLMALSNKFGWIVLTTGNKSEMSVGYSTLYGDSAGGFAVIKDVPKTLVYRLSRHRNTRSDAPIPEAILDRAPSAELRPGQRDDDSLPPYDVLDPILEGYVEDNLGRDALVVRGFPAADVDRTIKLVDRAEYKRRQQPPGIKITPRAFGRDRRMPDHQPLRRLRPVAHRDGHAGDGAAPAGVVGDLDVPDPRRAATVQAAGRRRGPCPTVIGRRKLVLLERPNATLRSAATAMVGGAGGQRLGDRGVEPAVHQSGRLEVLWADDDPRAGFLVAQLEPLHAVERLEPRDRDGGRTGGDRVAHVAPKTIAAPRTGPVALPAALRFAPHG